MTHLSLGVLVIPFALSIFSGCVSSQENVDAARVPRADDSVNDPQTETKTGMEAKVGVIDLIRVMTESKVGQPALATWTREVQEAAREEQQYLTQFHRYRQYYPGWTNPRHKAIRKAVNAIMPKVEAVIKTIAEKGDFSIVLDKGNSDIIFITIYSADMVDLTDQVIEELNQRFP